MSTDFDFQALNNMLGSLQRRILDLERITPLHQAIDYATSITFNPAIPGTLPDYMQDSGYVRSGSEYAFWFSLTFSGSVTVTARDVLAIIDLPFPVQVTRSLMGGCIGTWHVGLGSVIKYSGTMSPHTADPRLALLQGPLTSSITLNTVEGVVLTRVDPSKESSRLPRT